MIHFQIEQLKDYLKKDSTLLVTDIQPLVDKYEKLKEQVCKCYYEKKNVSLFIIYTAVLNQ